MSGMEWLLKILCHAISGELWLTDGKVRTVIFIINGEKWTYWKEGETWKKHDEDYNETNLKDAPEGIKSHRSRHSEYSEGLPDEKRNERKNIEDHRVENKRSTKKGAISIYSGICAILLYPVHDYFLPGFFPVKTMVLFHYSRNNLSFFINNSDLFCKKERKTAGVM